MARASAFCSISLGTIMEEDFSQETTKEEQEQVVDHYSTLIDAATNAVRQADAVLRRSKGASVLSSHAPHALRAVERNQEQLCQANENLSAILSQCLSALYEEQQQQHSNTMQISNVSRTAQTGPSLW
jgi:hypothetical protein